MRSLCLSAVLLIFFQLAHALQLGECHPEAAARKLLQAEGHRILSTPSGARSTVWFTKSRTDNGYVLRAGAEKKFCVVSLLPSVSSLQQAERGIDECTNANKSAEAKVICDRLQKAGFRPTGSATARSDTSSASQKIPGAVVTQFSFCADRAGTEVLCAIAETAQSKLSPK